MDETREILARHNAGDQDAASQLVVRVYDELRALADSYFRRLQPGDTLQPTALVHEVYMRLVKARDARWTSRAHFFAIAAMAMQQVLVNRARSGQAQKRGGGDWRKVTMLEDLAGVESETLDVLMLDETLTRLASVSVRQADIVKLRIFGGLTLEEIAEVLDVGLTTVKSDWLIAKAWLRHELAEVKPRDP